MASFNQAPLPCQLEVYCVAILSQIEQARKVKHVLCMNEVCAHVSRERELSKRSVSSFNWLKLALGDATRGARDGHTRHPLRLRYSLRRLHLEGGQEAPFRGRTHSAEMGTMGANNRRQNGALPPSNAATTRGVAMAFFDGSVETKNQKRHLNVFSTVVFVGARDMFAPFG